MLKTLICSLFCAIVFIGNAYALQEKILPVDNGHIHYYQIGEGQPVLLLHGLFADKEQWLQLVAQLQQANAHSNKKYQFIIPDLAGFGKSTDYPIEAYNLDSMQQISNTLNETQILHDFIQQLKITQPIDIAGNSMGGLLMVLYAQHYPAQVKSLAFIGSPAGISDFTQQFYTDGFRRGFNPFIPTTIDQFKTELYLLLVNYKAIMPNDDRIKSQIIPLMQTQYQQRTAVFNMLYPYKNYLQTKLAITQPIVIFWGANDYIFGRSQYAKNLCRNFARAQKCNYYVLPNAGHLLLLENQSTLDAIANRYQAYLQLNG